jgi:hypothetical protein
MRIAATLLGQSAPALDGPAIRALPWPFIKKNTSRGSVLLWFGPFTPAVPPDLWRELQQRHQAVGVRADDPWDAELPRNAKFSAYDPLAGRLTLLNTSSAAERAAHASWRERREAHFAALFPRLDDRLIVRNTDDPLQSLIAWFHRHRHRGADASCRS